MIFTPYHSIMNIEFGSSREAIIAVCGKPKREQITDMWASELEYPNKVFRIDKNNQLKEITVNLGEITLSDINIRFKNLASFIKNNDAGYFETVGFFVSPKYGIAFDPEFQSWITLFDQSELTKWYKFK